MGFLDLETEALGLDISDLSLKIAKLEKRKKRFSLASFGETKLEKGVIEQGQVKDGKALAQFLKKALLEVEGKKIRTREVICSLPEEKAFLQVIQLPRMKAAEARKAVFFEAENYIPLPLDEAYLDSEVITPLHDHLDHLDVLLAALPKATVDPYISSFRRAGLIPKALEIESLATARATIKGGRSPKPLLLIDLGATRTGFVIFAGTTIRFTSSIPVSSRLLTQSIVNCLGVEAEKAEGLKKKYGLAGPLKVKLVGKKKDGLEFERKVTYEKKVFEALLPPLIDLTEQIRSYLDYYLGHAAHEHLPPDHYQGIERILLSGGGANLKGLVSFLRDRLHLPVQLANPWVNILPPPLRGLPELPFTESLRYTTALGLALRGVKRG